MCINPITIFDKEKRPMDDLVFKVFAFYNPDRNTWKNYKYWFGEKQNPENPELEPTYLVPKVKAPENGGFKYNSFFDNIGCAPGVPNYKINAFLSRSDRQIYNTYFRNQSLENPLKVSLEDGDDDANENMELRRICKPRDYFTQALPTQSGTTPVEIPLGSEAPVIGNGKSLTLTSGGDNRSTLINFQQGNIPYAVVNQGGQGTDVGTARPTSGSPTGITYGISSNPNESGLIADLTQAMGAPLEGLYQAIAYNTYQYLTSRGGNRYFEHISNIYGVANPDGVLAQPEFLGSLSQLVDFETITQTSSTNSEPTPLGNRTANGYVENYGSIISKSFGEFGWIFIYGVVTNYPKYQQGVSKLMQIDDPLDLFNPIFNLMGDEPIYRSEIYVQSDSVVNEEGTPINDEVFGYGKRNARLIYPIDEIHGEQRSSYTQSLDAYHFAENFSEAPKLNKDFDKVSDEPLKRALTVTNETQFICNTLITGINDIEVPINAIPQPIPNLDTLGKA